MKYTKIIISGLPGAGSTSIALLLSYYLKMKYLYVGLIQRELAKLLGFDTEGEGFVKYLKDEVNKYDRLVDDKVKGLFETTDNFLLDSKIHGFFDYTEDVFKVYLYCSKEIRNKRIIDQGRKDGLKNLEDREKSTRDNFLKTYGFDISNMNDISERHNLVIDSSHLSISQTLEMILNDLNVKYEMKDLVNLEKVYWSLGKEYFKTELKKDNLIYDSSVIAKDIIAKYKQTH